MKLSQEMIDHLISLAKMHDVSIDGLSEDEDFNPHDLFGSHMDDAFDEGQQSGAIGLAREILHSMDISWDK